MTRSSLPRRIRPPACSVCRPTVATSTVLTRPAQARGELDHLWPEMLPGGRAVLFTITATGGLDAAQVAVLDLATGTSRVVVPGGSHAHYVPSGHLVYTAGGTLRAVPFDLDRLETRGTPVTVLPRLVTKSQGAAEFRRGRRRDPRVRGRARLRDGGEHAGVGGSAGPGGAAGCARGALRASARVAGRDARGGGQRESDIWVWDLARQTLSQLTFAPGPNFAPVWTKDGNRLLFFSPVREAGLFWQAADGTGAAERLGAGLPSGVTSDGKQVLFSSGQGLGT